MTEFTGIGIGSQMVSGKLRFLVAEEEKPKENGVPVSKNDEKALFLRAKDLTLAQQGRLYEKAKKEIGEREAEIFKIHAMLLEDEDFNEGILSLIENGKSALDAINEATEQCVNMLKDIDDPYLSARILDIKDISSQLKSKLVDNENDLNSDTAPYILVANDLTPSQTVMLDKSKLLGFVTMQGSGTSHTSILAKAMDIPALVAVGEIDSSYDGETALLDAQDSRLIINPSPKQMLDFEKKQSEKNKLKKAHEEYLASLLNKPAVSKGGHRVLIYSNIGGEYEVDTSLKNGAEGIGLLRTELHYLTLDKLPSEEQLFEAYRAIVVKMQGRRVVIRTLDIGADKKIPYLGLASEENPALGYRGIRICLDNKEIFKTQLRAILRASAFGRVAIMLPMIISADEIRRSKELIEECKQELFEKNEEFDSVIEFGIMIETPAAAIMCRELAPLVDFFSVGTNDLIQYTLAVDRQNPKVSHLCEENLEPILRLIESCSDAIHESGGWIGICGELGACLSLTQRFVDMGIDELSVSAPYLLGVRKRVCECK